MMMTGNFTARCDSFIEQVFSFVDFFQTAEGQGELINDGNKIGQIMR